MQRRTLLASGLLLAANRSSHAEPGSNPDPPPWPPTERIALWPADPPGMPSVAPAPSLTINGPPQQRELWVRGVARPEINVYRAPQPDGSSLLVFPGGAYTFLSVQNEGIEIARRFAPLGTTVFVLAYRLPGEGWAHRERIPLQDAQRAMRLLRARAAQLGIDPQRVGILGFSAGGHLAADLATAFDEHCYAPVDAQDQQSARPHFAGLIYPVASLQPGAGHDESRDQLLGPGATAAALARHSPAEHVTAATPPCFIVHALDDGVVPAEASFRMIAGCRQAAVMLEAHLFETGGHGFGLRSDPALPVSRWPELFSAWMRRHQ